MRAGYETATPSYGHLNGYLHGFSVARRAQGSGFFGMFRRRYKGVQRPVVEPLAESLGLSYNETFVSPPRSGEERILAAFRCGAHLLQTYAYPAEWCQDASSPGFPTPREAKKAARYLRDSLPTEAGRDAVAVITEAYARTRSAGLSRSVLDPSASHEAAKLSADALAIDQLATQVAEARPVHAYDHILHTIATLEPSHDLSAYPPVYHEMARCCASGQAVALHDRFDSLKSLIVAPILDYHSVYENQLSMSWIYISVLWDNLLLADEPLPWAEALSEATQQFHALVSEINAEE